ELPDVFQRLDPSAITAGRESDTRRNPFRIAAGAPARQRVIREHAVEHGARAVAVDALDDEADRNCETRVDRPSLPVARRRPRELLDPLLLLTIPFGSAETQPACVAVLRRWYSQLDLRNGSFGSCREGRTGTLGLQIQHPTDEGRCQNEQSERRQSSRPFP